MYNVKDQLADIQALMRCDIVDDARAAGISLTTLRARRMTAKRRALVGEIVQLRASGYINLDRWSKYGWSYADLARHSDVVAIVSDRHRHPIAAKVRIGG